MPRILLVDTTHIHTYVHISYVKELAIKTNCIFGILVLASEFIVVATLSEWWSVSTTTDHCGHIPVNCPRFPEDSIPFSTTWTCNSQERAGYVRL